MKKLLLLFSGIFLSFSLSAQWTPDSTLNTLIADAAGVEETTPLMAAAPNGYTYISWFKQDGGQYNLYMQLLDSVGVEKWTPGGKLISNQPQSTALFRYDLKTDNVGNAVVAFQDLRTGSDLTIAIYKLDKDGNHLFNQNGTVVFDSLANSNLAPVIGFNRRNQTIVAWSASDASNNKWISFQKFNAAGGPLYLGPKRIRDASGNKKFSRPTIVPASDTAGFVMQYVQEVGNFPGITNTMYAQRFDDFSMPVWNSAVQVSTYTITFFFFPTSMSDAQGGMWLPFNGPNPSNPAQTDVYLQHIDSSGNLWSATGARVSNLPNELRFYYDGCLTRTASGLMIAIQTKDLSQSSAGVAVQAFNLAGTPQYGSTAISVLPLSTSIHQPFGFDNTGLGAILCYQLGGFGNQELRAMNVNYNGSVGWNRSLCDVSSNKDDMAAGEVMNAQLVTVWKDGRLDNGIYAQNISTYGTAGVLTSLNAVVSPETISIQPNPGRNPEIRLSGDLYGSTKVEISDIQGKVLKTDIFQGTTYQPELDLQSGIYLIRLTNNGQSATVRWMIR
jgi:hypothetical protein